MDPTHSNTHVHSPLPGPPHPDSLLVHLTLRPTPSPTDPTKTLYVISEHEDFYHPDDLAALVVPPLAPLIRLALHAATLACRVNARVFEALGFWRVKEGEGGQGVRLRPEGEALPPIGEEEEGELEGRRKED